ncbi:MAG: hypothetical protein RLZZ124_1409 [Cyanobacteriota bacterium]
MPKRPPQLMHRTFALDLAAFCPGGWRGRPQSARPRAGTPPAHRAAPQAQGFIDDWTTPRAHLPLTICVELKAGPIVSVDWRKAPGDPAQDLRHPEPNRLRPAVVVQDTELLDPAYPMVLLVLTSEPVQRCLPIAASWLAATAMCRWQPSAERLLERLRIPSSPWIVVA